MGSITQLAGGYINTSLQSGNETQMTEKLEAIRRRLDGMKGRVVVGVAMAWGGGWEKFWGFWKENGKGVVTGAGGDSKSMVTAAQRQQATATAALTAESEVSTVPKCHIPFQALL
jgi:ABC-type Fe3+-hydroxamate transport system substrate-binding protein